FEYQPSSSPLVSFVQTFRRDTFLPLKREAGDYWKNLSDAGDAGFKQMQHAWEHVQNEENTPARYATYVGGGILGRLLAWNRGRILRVVYTSLGAAVALGTLNPKESRELGTVLQKEAVTFGKTAYNFVQGATPGEVKPSKAVPIVSVANEMDVPKSKEGEVKD
ncbi:unnamed protein product, partial [Cyprideis torosa]